MDLPEEFTRYVKRHYRWNFGVNLADFAMYMFGTSFIAPATILPIFVTKFTSNPLILSLIPFIGSAGFLLPQLILSNYIERSPRKKFFPVNIGFFTERIPVLLMAPAIYFLAEGSPTTMLVVFFFLYAWQTLGAGLIIVGWQDLIAKVIPVERRGRFFGLSNFAGNVFGIAGASAVTLLLARTSFPTGYVLSFGLAAFFILVSWVFLALTREPPDPVSKPVISTVEYFKKLPSVIRENPNFNQFLIAQVVIGFGGMGAGFLMFAALDKWTLPESLAASFAIAMLVGQLGANLVFGFLADRRGNKILLEISILFNILAFALTVFALDPIWFYGVFFLRGISMAASFVALNALPMEFSQPQDRPTFIALAGTLLGLANVVAPLAGGLIAKAWGYPQLFLVSIVISVLGFFILRLRVKEPRHHVDNPVVTAPDASLEV